MFLFNILQCREEMLDGQDMDVMDAYLPRDKLLADITKTMNKMISDLEVRFPSWGCGIHEYAMAHLLDPHFKGHFLKAHLRFEPTKQRLIDDHPSTAEFQNPASQDLNAAVLLPDDLDPAELEFAMAQAGPEAPGQLPPIQIELESFLLQPDPGRDVDVLKWWHAKRNEYKLLAPFAL